MLVLDAAQCWLYETYNTNRCNGLYDASSEAIWDMTGSESRPWGWISADAGGLPVFAGLVRYDEANSGVINHALAFTMNPTAGDASGGYFVLPASASSSTNTTADLLPMGARAAPALQPQHLQLLRHQSDHSDSVACSTG